MHYMRATLCFCLLLLMTYSSLMIIAAIFKNHGSSNEADVKVESEIKKDPAFNLDLDMHHKLIILLTSFRGGSSFLGNVFDINPRLQYLYEPFYGGHIQHLYEKGWIAGARADHSESDLKMLYIQQIVHNCSVYGTPFPERHEFCGSDEEHIHRFNSTTCNMKLWRDGAGHQEICRYRNITVMKVIRFPVLSDILKISNIHAANVFIVHLVRHPSPVLMSRRTGGLFYMWRSSSFKSVKLEAAPGVYSDRRIKIAWEAFNYCRDNIESSEFAKHHPWLKDRYLQITHRDMSLQPLQTTQKIYDFVNETLTDQVKDYIISITDGSQVADKSKVKMKKNPLEVRKNSTTVVDAWKNLYTQVYYWDVISIEAQCKLLFKLLSEDKFSVDRMSTSKLKKVYLAS